MIVNIFFYLLFNLGLVSFSECKSFYSHFSHDFFIPILTMVKFIFFLEDLVLRWFHSLYLLYFLPTIPENFIHR